MNDPVNLNRARKARDRVKEKSRADENAVRFGQTKAERLRQARLNERASHSLDGQKFEAE